MIASVLKNIPLLSKFAFDEIKIQILSGLTNKNYLVTIPSDPKQKTILRIPRESTDEFINRDNESHNTDIAEQLGIAPKNLWREVSGISLTEYLENTTKPKLDKPQTLDKIAKALTTLHNSKTIFKGELNNQKITKLLIQYFEKCSNKKQRSLKPDYQKTLALLEAPLSVRSAVPSHIDLVQENILHQGEKVWFIDWEYSAMASPFWDIAIFCNSAEIDSSLSESLLKQVLNNYQASDLQCLNHYRFIAQVVSDCWQAAFVQSPQ